MPRQPQKSWSEWKARHQDHLFTTSLPTHVWRTERKLGYFLEHGHLPADSAGPEANLDGLSPTDARVLLNAIDDYETHHPGAANAIRARLVGLAAKN